MSIRTYVLTWQEYGEGTYIIYAGNDEAIAHDIHKFIGKHDAVSDSNDVDMHIRRDSGVFKLHVFEDGKKIAAKHSYDSTSLNDFKWTELDPEQGYIELQ